jgi:membrane fusion protein, multidrug efflux system
MQSMSCRALFVVSFCAVLSVAACGKNEATTADPKPNAVSQASPSANKGDQNGGRNGAPNGGNAMGGQNGGSRMGGRQQPPAAVITAMATEVPFLSEVEALGTAKANEAIDVTAKVTNRVKSIHFREGQFVHTGDVLVELDPNETSGDLAVAEAALADIRGQVNRSRELYQSKALSAQQMDQLELNLQANEARVASARSRFNEQTIRAAFNGRVGLRNVSVGSLLNPGTVITTLDDISVMKLDFSVPETFLASLTAGQTIEATSAAYAGQKFSGYVLSIGSRVDPVSRSIVVRAQLPNRDGKLKPGMFMTVHLSAGANTGLVIPEQALVPERDKQFVFAIRDGKAVKTEVTLGRRRPGEVEVVKGLTAGEVVIVEGTQKVRDGGAVRVANETE